MAKKIKNKQNKMLKKRKDALPVFKLKLVSPVIALHQVLRPELASSAEQQKESLGEPLPTQSIFLVLNIFDGMWRENETEPLKAISQLLSTTVNVLLSMHSISFHSSPGTSPQPQVLLHPHQIALRECVGEAYQHRCL